MKLPKPGEGGEMESVPAGTHVGVCYRFIDMGTQKVEWQGQIQHKRKVMISWLTPDELMSDGRPFSVHKRYTWSMHEKAALRHDLESWRGKAFTMDDFEGPNAFNTKKLIGQPCMLTVTHDSRDGKTYTNVASVGKLMKGVKPGELTEPTVYISLEKGEFDQAAFDALKDGLKERIASSPEYQELKGAGKQSLSDDEAYAGVDPDDTIPF
jgi:hypothetical protein